MQSRQNTYALLTVLMVVAALFVAIGCAPVAPPAPATAPTSAPAAPQGQAQDVKIGILLPLTGSAASYSQRVKFGFDLAQEEINKAGGIKSLGGAKLNLIYADTQAKPEVGVSEAQRLALQENVVVILGALYSSTTYPASEISERYKVPWLVQSSVRDDITDRGFKYLFRANQKSALDAATMVNTMVEMNKRMKTDYKTIALVYDNSDAPQANMANLKKLAAQAGFTIVADESFPPNAADLAPQALKAKGASPDVLMMAMSTPDGILFQKALADNNVDVKAIISYGDSTSDPAYYEALGKRAEYVISNNEWDSGLVATIPAAKVVNDAFTAKFNEPMPAHAAQAYSNIYIIADALERAGSVDRDKVRDALAKTSITSGPAMIMPYAKIEFGPDGQNPYPREVATQYLNGKNHIVYPTELMEPGFVPGWPAPSWAERNK